VKNRTASIYNLDRNPIIPIKGSGKPNSDVPRLAPSNRVERVAADCLDEVAVAPAGDLEPQIEGPEIAVAAVGGVDLDQDVGGGSEDLDRGPPVGHAFGDAGGGGGRTPGWRRGRCRPLRRPRCRRRFRDRHGHPLGRSLDDGGGGGGDGRRRVAGQGRWRRRDDGRLILL